MWDMGNAGYHRVACVWVCVSACVWSVVEDSGKDTDSPKRPFSLTQVDDWISRFEILIDLHVAL